MNGCEFQLTAIMALLVYCAVVQSHILKAILEQTEWLQEPESDEVDGDGAQ